MYNLPAPFPTLKVATDLNVDFKSTHPQSPIQANLGFTYGLPTFQLALRPSLYIEPNQGAQNFGEVHRSLSVVIHMLFGAGTLSLSDGLQSQAHCLRSITIK